MDDILILIFAVLAIVLIIVGVTIAKQVVKRRIRSERSRGLQDDRPLKGDVEGKGPDVV